MLVSNQDTHTNPLGVQAFYGAQEVALSAVTVREASDALAKVGVDIDAIAGEV